MTLYPSALCCVTRPRPPVITIPAKSASSQSIPSQEEQGKSQGGGGRRACYTCNQEEELSRDCSPRRRLSAARSIATTRARFRACRPSTKLQSAEFSRVGPSRLQAVTVRQRKSLSLGFEAERGFRGTPRVARFQGVEPTST